MNPSSILDPRILARVGDLELVARTIVDGLRSGPHRSPFHGYSAEFSQYRHYRPGDDLKYVDWKLAARTDRVYTKQFRETTDLAAALVLDHDRASAAAVSEARVVIELAATERAAQRIDEAARRLGWTPGSVKGRLERGRARIHARLLRRGLTLSALAAVEAMRSPAAEAGSGLAAWPPGSGTTNAGRTVIPYAAVLYDAHGDAWVYTNPEPLVFVRHRVSIAYIDGDRAVLSDGPPVGTAVVTAGGAELLGAELKVVDEVGEDDEPQNVALARFIQDHDVEAGRREIEALDDSRKRHDPHRDRTPAPIERPFRLFFEPADVLARALPYLRV